MSNDAKLILGVLMRASDLNRGQEVCGGSPGLQCAPNHHCLSSGPEWLNLFLPALSKGPI